MPDHDEVDDNDDHDDHDDVDDDDFHLNPVGTKRLLPRFVPKQFSETLNVPPDMGHVLYV